MTSVNPVSTHGPNVVLIATSVASRPRAPTYVVTPAGAKSCAVDYRAGSGRGAPKRRFTIGKHGSPWTPETARIEAKRLLAEVAAGRDPATARQQERDALTFGELIDLYLAEGAGHKKASTLKADQGRIEHHLRPLLGKLRADRIGRPGSIATGGKGAAAQCVALVSSIYAFAIGRGLCADNPARGVKKAPLSVPARRPIKPVYVRRSVAFISLHSPAVDRGRRRRLAGRVLRSARLHVGRRDD